MSTLKTIALIIAALWLLGFFTNIGGALIHALIVIALVIFVIDMLAGRKAV